MINPSITLTNFRNGNKYYPAYHVTFARKTRNSPFTVGYTVGYNYLNNYNFTHELSIAYYFPIPANKQNTSEGNN